MNAEAVKASYRRMLGEFETIKIRRYSGAPRIAHDYDCLAKPTGYAGNELVGAVVQGDVKIYVFVSDLAATAITLPVTTNDKAVIAGKELAILAVDQNTIRINGQTIAYILQARG